MPDLPVESADPPQEEMPRWVIRAVVIFWVGFMVTVLIRGLFHRVDSLLVVLLVSLFVSLAVEPGVNRLAARGWRRGSATVLILLGVLVIFLVFLTAVGTLVANQIAELLGNSDIYVTRTVNFINDVFNTNIDPRDVIAEINNPNGRIQEYIASQGDRVVRLSITALGVLLQAFSVLLFSFYLVADGPRRRRSICSRLRPARQVRVLNAWELAIDKTGGYLSTEALLGGLSALFHWVVFQAIGTQAPVALALWVGLVSQFLPVVGTYLAGILPVVVTFVDSPVHALIVLGFIVLYQQIENYLLAPRITARTMELHPALAFGAALAGAAVLGAVGAVLALPAAAMAQALIGSSGKRYDVVDSHLVAVRSPLEVRQRRRRPAVPPKDDADGTSTHDTV